MRFLADCFYSGGKEDSLDVAKREPEDLSHPWVQWAKGTGRARAHLQGTALAPAERQSKMLVPRTGFYRQTSQGLRQGSWEPQSSGMRPESALLLKNSGQAGRAPGQQASCLDQSSTEAHVLLFFHNIFHNHTP